VRTKRENGVALITVLLILFLVSALVVGMSWMVMSDQHLGGNNQNRETAFYAAEAGMESMTAQMGNTFAQQGSITAANLVTITSPANQPVIPGVTYQNALGASTYNIGCPDPTVVCAVIPPSQNATIRPPSPYAGMSGLITPFTLSVAAQTNMGSEVKLQRQVQLVAIPVFQFGIFSNTDLAFFNGPPFDFGGRVHTNGNLWLAANEGPLYIRNKVTVVGQVIRTNLENGLPITAGSYDGVVTIALAPLPPLPTDYPPASGTNAQWRALGLGEGSMLGPNAYQALSGNANTPTWGNTTPLYLGELTNGVQPLNLISTALSGLSTPAALIHRPAVGEQGTNLAQFNQRYFSNTQASLRILLDDYGLGFVAGQANACNTSPMMALDTVSTGTPPVDLATLAYDKASNFNFTAATGKPAAAAWYTGGFPLPLSQGPAVGAAYNAYNVGAAPVGPKDGYWQAKNTPIIQGCIKIEYVAPGAATATDVTQQILNYGVTGRNIYPQTGGLANQLLFLPTTGTNPPTPGGASAESATCGAASDAGEPSPNAIIRIARVRDNPSTAYAVPATPCTATQSGYDYWPMVLYDTREAISRDSATANTAPAGMTNNAADQTGGITRPFITAEGVMDYIELDANNLSKWFMNTLPTAGSGAAANGVGGYEVYFSDRRGNQVDPSPGIGVQTGEFGFNDIVNRSDAVNGCPNNALDQPGEDFDGDGVLRTYGGVPLSAAAVPVNQKVQSVVTGVSSALLIGVPASVLTVNPNCGAAGTPPGPNYVYTHAQEARENPPLFFRRALKIEYGETFTLGTACFGAAPNPPCGLTVASENPVYIQGDYNNAGATTNFTGASVASSVAADAVTLLSDSWNDVNSFISPYDPSSRVGAQTTYRVAIIAGKGIPFAQTAGSQPDYGTDGGLHNFLRYLEGWGGANLYYEGSLVSFYYNRQAIGIYKCCNTVYGPPARVYNFDGNFTNGPQWLPPRTPTLRSINTIGFTQELNPNQ
jgi:PilX N-terminal